MVDGAFDFMKPYSESLRDPRWQKFRLAVLEAANWRCEHCNDSTSELHVHHSYYRAGHDPWMYPQNSMVALCDRCHGEVHKHQGAVKEAISKALRLVPGQRMAKVAEWILANALEGER